MRSLVAGAALVLLSATTAACSSEPAAAPSSTVSSSSEVASSEVASSTAAASGSTGFPAGKEQICQARDQLSTSINALTDMKLLASGTDAIKAAVDQVQTDLDNLATAAKDDYRPQVTAVQTALQQLKTATGNLGDGNGSQALMAVGAAIVATGTAANDLLTQLKTACGS